MHLDPAVLALIGELDFDPESLRQKYAAERDMRLRADGSSQYMGTKATFSYFADDPYIKRDLTRPACHDRVDFTIIGGGFGGLLMGARLREIGVKNIRVVESGGDFGGTWYWNRYPGAMCDVESYCYLPLLEELNYIPKQKYSFAPEIYEHCRNIARHYGLYNNALLQTTISELRWDEHERYWQISTDRGDQFLTRFVAMANGPLSAPKLPRIPGIETFRGHAFHTSRWDYEYTGGNSQGNLDKLKDKRVGIIGTGATAIQCIPHLGASAKHLYVFQRTPSSVDIRNNGPTDPIWAATLEPGWQRRRQENFNSLVSGGDQEEDLVQDGWTEIFRSVTAVAARELSRKLGRRLTQEERDTIVRIADYRKMNAIRARVDSIISDPTTAESLKPWYRQFCKRPCFHDEYLQTFNRSNVTLVDTRGKGVEEIRGDFVVVNEHFYELDCLIFATGFDVATPFAKRIGYEIVGRDGVHLSEQWRNGFRTMHGMTANEFPNCFFLGYVQSAITVNVPHALDEQARHVAYIVDRTLKSNKTLVEPTAEAVNEYLAEVDRLAQIDQEFFLECTPSYFNGEGSKDTRDRFVLNMYGAGPVKFFELLKRWREEGSMKGLVVS